jgi:hypothetical protein
MFFVLAGLSESRWQRRGIPFNRNAGYRVWSVGMTAYAWREHVSRVGWNKLQNSLLLRLGGHDAYPKKGMEALP